MAKVKVIQELIEPQTTLEWQELACSRLELILRVARGFPVLAKWWKNTWKDSRTPGGSLGSVKTLWSAEVQLVGKTSMVRLNSVYRQKNYPTDVLSFPAPAPFLKQGMLGELIVCLPVLKAQAREMKSSPLCELDVLLVHGVLHLLGLDHERGPKEAALMARWETRLLDGVQAKTKKSQRGLGLIERSNSDKESA